MQYTLCGLALALGCTSEDPPRAIGGGEGGTDGVDGPSDDAEGGQGDESGNGVGGASGGGSGCFTDDDCSGPGTNVCNEATGRCVSCLDDDDCGGLTCTAATGFCTGCTVDEECPQRTTCTMSGSCIPGCSADQACPSGFECCDGECAELSTDTDHCGSCGNACDAPSGAFATCLGGECGAGACEEGFSDCNQTQSDGCEVEGTCFCAPGATQSCYTGSAGTADIGACRSGIQTCNDFGTAFGACTGEITPTAEICANNADDDCDGLADEDPDNDADGWTLCGGDCCDTQGPNCLDPQLVNPGAFEVAGNDVDDDCDGSVDNAVETCDAGLVSNSNSALDYARALDLCQFTEADPDDREDRIWGVIEAELTLTNGGGTPAANSRSLRNGFGNNITNRFGDRIVVLSTGHAADNAGDSNPNFASFEQGQEMGTSSPFPSDWFASQGNALPNASGCPAAAAAVQDAQDPVMLTLRVRVPTNANSFAVDMFFLSSEYPEWVCTPFNDFFVTLVDSASPDNPNDKNIAIYDDGNVSSSVGVNLLSAAEGLFTACASGEYGQCTDQFGDPYTGGIYSGCSSNAELSGTGFDIDATQYLGCEPDVAVGGGTGWLRMSGNVSPGEIMTIRFAIWDTSDQLYDSLVLLDNWEWSVEASAPGIEPA